MLFEDSGIEGTVIKFSTLEDIMKSLHIIRGGQWDWERVTYDYKFENRTTGAIYYLRVQGVAIEGEFEKSEAITQLKTPILGHYYYPHGVEYDEEMPEDIVNTSQKLLSQLRELLDEYEQDTPESESESEQAKTASITEALLDIEGVDNVSEFHLVNDNEGHSILSCHLITTTADANTLVDHATQMLRESFDIQHSTIQVDFDKEKVTE